MADLVLLALVIPGFFYVNSQLSSPAKFEVTGLALDPEWIQVGELTQVFANVTNKGDTSGNYTVTLAIDDVVLSTQTVQLLGGETSSVVFLATEQTEGNHTITVENMDVALKVTLEAPTRPAKLQLTNLVTSRNVAGIGDPVTVSVTAANIGDQADNFTLDLYVNEQKRETKTVSLDGGESKLVQFEIIENFEGDYVVKLKDLVTSFRISSDAQSTKPAEFQITDLEVNPSSVLINEVVKISVKLTNIGEETGSDILTLKIDGVEKESKEITLAGQAYEIVEFEVIDASSGTHSVEIGNLFESFTVEDLAPASPNTRLYSLSVSPYEIWTGEPVAVKALADNLSNEPATLQVRILVGDIFQEIKSVSLEAGATGVPVEFSVTAESEPIEGKTEGYRVELVNLGNQTNSLRGFFQVAPNGFHTLSINRSGGGSTPMVFVLDGETYETPYLELKPVGEYSISTDEIVDLGTGVVEFNHWQDGVESASRTFVLDGHLSVLAHYIVISGYASCPSLYIWNGANYSYVTEVSNAGWLGYIDYIDDSGDIIFGGGNPWDYVKLDPNQLALREDNGESYYDIVLFQQWDEIFYLDAAYLTVVDHPEDVDVYSTMVNYVNPGFYGEIYTVNGDELLTPISATNEKGDDVLSEISHLDGVFTPASNGVLSPSWDNITFNQLTLDLGDLSGAPGIKLLINGMVDWGPPEPYYDWIDQFKEAFTEGLVPNGTQINPPPYMEVMDAQGNWIRIPQDRQMPTPGDYVPRTFAVDLMGLFPAEVSNYRLRITNFWNVTFDYIAIDVSPQENISIYEIPPVATLEPLGFAATVTDASGNFTKYGDVSPLLTEADDMFVIGLQGDKVSIKFSTSDLPALETGMKRSVFLFVASWFKDKIGNWGYGFDFTVEPLPFQDMSGFPYPSSESYPSSQEYINYLKEWNTRAVNNP